MNPEIPAMSSVMNTRARNRAYCREKHQKNQLSNQAEGPNVAETHHFQHPGSTFAGGEAPEEAKEHDGPSGTGEDVRAVGGAVGNQ